MRLSLPYYFIVRGCLPPRMLAGAVTETYRITCRASPGSHVSRPLGSHKGPSPVGGGVAASRACCLCAVRLPRGSVASGARRVALLRCRRASGRAGSHAAARSTQAWLPLDKLAMKFSAAVNRWPHAGRQTARRVHTCRPQRHRTPQATHLNLPLHGSCPNLHS
ncbi:hypothetical protein O0L34_g1417 [Tuta absoluta]|nr:hypothetical protein O0L34_g1417 [Tuta absoluta]